MKHISLAGYSVAHAYLYKHKIDGFEMNDNLHKIFTRLNIIMKSYMRKKHAVLKIQKKALEKVMGVDDKIEVEIICFIMQLILKNPDKNKNKILTELAEDENRQFLFKKDDVLKNSKSYVNKFYNIGDNKV